jgi:hypothetical protein
VRVLALRRLLDYYHQPDGQQHDCPTLAEVLQKWLLEREPVSKTPSRVDLDSEEVSASCP